jgi:hypothetical protein
MSEEFNSIERKTGKQVYLVTTRGIVRPIVRHAAKVIPGSREDLPGSMLGRSQLSQSERLGAFSVRLVKLVKLVKRHRTTSGRSGLNLQPT